MLVKIIRADNNIELFQTENYVIGQPKEFHPIICKVSVYSNDGQLIFKRKRPFSFFYKHFKFKSKEIQDKLKELEKNNGKQQ